MALVVLGEKEPILPVVVGGEPAQLVPQHLLLKELFTNPQRDRHPERREALRSEREIGLEQSLEFEKRLVVENDMVDVVQSDAACFEAVGQCATREVGIVLLAREAPLLGGGTNPAIRDQGRCTVVIEGGDSDD